MQITSFPDHLPTPAFVYDETEVNRALDIAQYLRSTSGCRFLYSLKPLCLVPLLKFMAPRLDGFAVSSPFEARLARSVSPEKGSVHFTSPGIRPGDLPDLATFCDFISFNSLTQWERYGVHFQGRGQLGLRINPGLSFLDDERYDPCRENSKLGLPLADLAELLRNAGSALAGVNGILIHTNCESTNFMELEQTVERVAEAVPELLESCRWINLGGGYLFPEEVDLAPLIRLIQWLRNRYSMDVYLEPGAALVRSAGYMIATVLDIFSSDHKQVAVLDATINHMPELLEFDFEPDVEGHNDDGEWEYILAGCTCLAGDIFGEYRFDHPLAVGDRVVFRNVGAYTLTKAHTFNGVNLPDIYARDIQGNLVPVKKFGYSEYAARWGDYAGDPV